MLRFLAPSMAAVDRVTAFGALEQRFHAHSVVLSESSIGIDNNPCRPRCRSFYRRHTHPGRCARHLRQPARPPSILKR
jgi:hypothetical protein